MAALPDLITMAQFEQLPDNPATRCELHHGQIVEMTQPRIRHVKVQDRLAYLLKPLLKSFAVIIECPYRAVAEFEFRRADVAAVSRGRWDGLGDEDLFGAPELVVEVLSPSNTKAQLRDLVALCLTHGSLQCWIVDPKKKSVTVVCRGGEQQVFETGSRIPLTEFGAGSLSVDEIFAEP